MARAEQGERFRMRAEEQRQRAGRELRAARVLLDGVRRRRLRRRGLRLSLGQEQLESRDADEQLRLELVESRLRLLLCRAEAWRVYGSELLAGQGLRTLRASRATRGPADA